MLRRFVLLLFISGWALAADHSAAVTILTQNMDDGTDQTYIVGALSGQISLTLPQAVDLTFQELQASDFFGRASLLAGRIAELKPDLVALQEAALWYSTSLNTGETTVLADELALLRAALRSAGVPYEVVAVAAVNDLTLPGQDYVAALHFTDRNALLVRADLCPPAFHLSEVRSRIFDASFVFQGLQVHAGWISVQVHTGNRHFRLVTTHLQSPVPGVKLATETQIAQAGELIQDLRNSTLPVVLCGDFNSDANGGQFVDATPTARLIEDAGYLEVWSRLHPGDPGLTWPFYLEDQFPPPPFVIPWTPMERIDLFFSQGIQPVSAELVVAPGSGGSPLYASDHAGVIAGFQAGDRP